MPPSVGRIAEPTPVGASVVQSLHQLLDAPLLNVQIAQEAVDTAVPKCRGDSPLARVIVGIDEEPDVIAIKEGLQSGLCLEQSTGRCMAASMLWR